MKARLIILSAIVASWALAAFLLSDLSPWRPDRLAAVPTRTPQVTFTPSATPTLTLTPSATPTPTATPTATPSPTSTPLPTATPTPTPSPTDTPSPVPTPSPIAAPATRTRAPQPPAAPSRSPTAQRPKPTSTPALPFLGQIVNGWPNCGTTGVWGYVVHGGSPYPGALVGVWSDGWPGILSGPAEADGKYTVDNVPAGSYYLAVVDPATCSRRDDGQLAASNCRRLSNVVGVTLFDLSACQQAGTVQWAEVHFRGP